VSKAREEDIGRLYGTMLTRISSFVFPRINYGATVDLTPIPANVTTIEAERRSKHPFPARDDVHTHACNHSADHTIDLQHLTTLTVPNTIGDLWDWTVSWFSRRFVLSCAGISR
jgi:hypothetical protein